MLASFPISGTDWPSALPNPKHAKKIAFGKGELRIEEHVQLGVIIQYVTTLAKTHDQAPPPTTGFDGSTG